MSDSQEEGNGSLARRLGSWLGQQSSTSQHLIRAVLVIGVGYLLYQVGIGALGFLVGIVLAVFAYLAPALVADRRKMPNKNSVFVINLLLGWTVIGWVVALAMALAGNPTSPSSGTAPRADQVPILPDGRTCPHCAEEIKAAAIVCKHCGRDVVPVV